MVSYLDFQAEPDDNQASPPIGAPEGNYKGNVVNNTFRAVMSAIRNLGDSALHTDGRNVPSADTPWGGFKITNLGEGTARLHAARVAQIQDGRVTWGGTTGGTGAAYTVTLVPIYTAVSYAPGMQVRALVHATNIVTTPTLNAGTPGAKTIVHRNGAALGLGSLRINTRYTFEFDGTSWRALDAGGYMEQATYDAQWPVNGPIMIRYDTVNPNTTLPAGVTATWTQISDTGRLISIDSGEAPGATSGSDTTPLPNHSHSDGSLSASDTLGTRSDILGGGSLTVVNDTSVSADVSGNTGGVNTNPDIAINPRRRNYRGWRRTA